MQISNFKTIASVLTLFFALIAMPVNAQQAKKAFERMNTIKKVKLLELLDLDEQKSDKFLLLFNKYEKEFHALKEKMDLVMAEMKLLVKSDGNNAKINEKITEMFNLREKFMVMQKEKDDKVRKILDDKQFARYLIFEHEFVHELRRQMFEIHKRKKGDRDRRNKNRDDIPPPPPGDELLNNQETD